MNEEYGVILISSTEVAMKIEKLGKEHQLQIRIIPTPQAIQKSCGFSIKYQLEEEKAVKALIKENQIETDTFYHAQRQGLKVQYEEVGFYN